MKGNLIVKGFSNTNVFKVILIMVLVLVIIIIYTTAAAGSNFLSNILGFTTTPMQNISSNVTDSVTEFLDLDSLSDEEVRAMAQRLSDENSQLRRDLVDYYTISQENEQLKKLLDIKEELRDAEYVAASVIQRDPNDIFYGFAIDKGSLAGVNLGDPVITEKGLVGVISEVYATTSMVKSILNEDVSIAAISKEIDENGVITSNILTAADGTLRLEYLKNDTKMYEGAIITSSGAGGAYPKDLVIGYVERIEYSEYDISKYAVVVPYEDVKNVKDIFVMVGFPGKGEATADTGIDNIGDADQDVEAN